LSWGGGGGFLRVSGGLVFMGGLPSNLLFVGESLSRKVALFI
jgi:hypothetical protein